MNNSKKFDWPGWPLKNNPYGKEFDLAARKRMIAGSKTLNPFLKKYKKDLGSKILEVGPFFHPLITSKKYPKTKIFYWENDCNVLRYLKKNRPQKTVYPIYCDLNKITNNSFVKYKFHKTYFDSAVISQVFNYIDYERLLKTLKKFIKKDGLLFINNTVDYGLPAFFSHNRPKSIAHTIKTIEKNGYRILEQKILKSPNKKRQKRLIIVAKKDK